MKVGYFIRWIREVYIHLPKETKDYRVGSFSVALTSLLPQLYLLPALGDIRLGSVRSQSSLYIVVQIIVGRVFPARFVVGRVHDNNKEKEYLI